MSSTGCLTDATNVDSEDKTTVENAGKQESEEGRNARIRAHAERILACYK